MVACVGGVGQGGLKVERERVESSEKKRKRKERKEKIIF